MMRTHYGYQIMYFVVGLLLNQACCTPGYFELMRQNCPFTDFCSVKSLESYNASSTMTPCCSKCYCEADCWVLNNCCPDVNHTEPADLKKANCIPMLVTKQFYPEQTMMDSTYKLYLVIDFCPRHYDFIDQGLLDNCEENFDDSIVFNDIVAVSDGKGRIYKNRFCALCHGVHDVVRWNLVMRSYEGKVINTTVEATDYLHTLMDNYPLESVIPKELSYTSIGMECMDDILPDCPDSPHPEIQQGCLLGPNMPFYFKYPKSQVFIRHKNVLCHVCQDSMDIPHMCQEDLVHSQKTLFADFSLLLDTTISERVSESKPLNSCSSLAVWDHVKRQCLKLYCPPFSVFVDGGCLTLGHVSNAQLLLLVLLEPREQSPILDNVQYYDERKTMLYVHDALKRYELSMCITQEFSLRVLAEKSNRTLAYAQTIIILNLDGKCQLEDISRAVRTRSLTYKDTSLAINGVMYQFTEKIDFYYERYTDIDLERYIYWDMIFYIRTYNSLTMLDGFFICPHFIFNIQEYNAVITDVFGKHDKNLTEISAFTRVQNGFYTLYPNSIAICVDTYFELYKKNGCDSNIRMSSVSFPGTLLVGVLYLSTSDLYFI